MQRRRNQQSGYSLMEILVAMAVSTVVIIIAYDLIDSAMRTALFVESHNSLSQWAQRPINFMQTEIYQNKTIFDGANVGSGTGNYLTRFTTPPTYPEPGRRAARADAVSRRQSCRSAGLPPYRRCKSIRSFPVPMPATSWGPTRLVARGSQEISC